MSLADSDEALQTLPGLRAYRTEELEKFRKLLVAKPLFGDALQRWLKQTERGKTILASWPDTPSEHERNALSRTYYAALVFIVENPEALALIAAQGPPPPDAHQIERCRLDWAAEWKKNDVFRSVFEALMNPHTSKWMEVSARYAHVPQDVRDVRRLHLVVEGLREQIERYFVLGEMPPMLGTLPAVRKAIGLLDEVTRGRSLRSSRLTIIREISLLAHCGYEDLPPRDPIDGMPTFPKPAPESTKNSWSFEVSSGLHGLQRLYEIEPNIIRNLFRFWPPRRGRKKGADKGEADSLGHLGRVLELALGKRVPRRTLEADVHHVLAKLRQDRKGR